ncbi:serine hydrolase domain-containing protein [Streptomyces sp. NPDC086777]|uniref:serine hydrolase domain-containing protein n=1 Tax=Streptomyces sp. NPDC086777 TaxID=3154866 RepID=UPI00344C7019
MALDLDIDRIREVVDEGVRDKVYPGAVWAVGDRSNMAIGMPGVLDPDRPDEPMRHDTVFDVGALTEVLAVWPVIGSLVEDGTLGLDEKLDGFWSQAYGHPLGRATIRHLLTHTAGVPLRAEQPRDIRDGVLHEAVHRPPGEAVEYTDRDAVVLGQLAEDLCGRSLDVLAATRVWQPLGMTRTCYGPLPGETAARCAPTELDDATGSRLRGTAHDSPAHLPGGVRGSSGVFSVLPDLAAFLRHLLQPGHGGARPGFGPAWVQESLRIRTGDLTPPGGLFWHPAPETDGIWTPHGSPGAGVWLSPQQGRWAVLLTNELYYTRDPAPIGHIRDAFRSRAFA